MKRNTLLISLSILCAVCILSCLGLVAINAAKPTMGLTTHVCIGLVTTPRWQFGLSWAHPISSYAPPLSFSPYAACTDIPDNWISFTSKMAGELMFPP